MKTPKRNRSAPRSGPWADGRRRRGVGRRRLRRGASTIDYILVLGVVLPLATFIMVIAPRMIKVAYEMLCTLVSWPFM